MASVRFFWLMFLITSSYKPPGVHSQHIQALVQPLAFSLVVKKISFACTLNPEFSSDFQ